MTGDLLVVSTRFSYDELGRQLEQIDAEGRVTRYSYDGMGRRESRRLPMGQYEIFTYHADGNLAMRTDFLSNEGSPKTRYYFYDELGRLITERAGGQQRGGLRLRPFSLLLLHGGGSAQDAEGV